MINTHDIIDVTSAPQQINHKHNNKEKNELRKLIHQSKCRFLKANIKKSGRNQFHKYTYYELKDIVPVFLEISTELGLWSKFIFTDKTATLVVGNMWNDTTEEYTCPLPPVTTADPKKAMQEIGALQTYARRYLYIQLLDIVEADTIDSEK